MLSQWQSNVNSSSGGGIHATAHGVAAVVRDKTRLWGVAGYSFVAGRRTRLLLGAKAIRSPVFSADRPPAPWLSTPCLESSVRASMALHQGYQLHTLHTHHLNPSTATQ